MTEGIKTVIIGILFVLVLILGEAVGTLIDQKEEIGIKLQTQIEKSSDLEMTLEDKFIKDYLRSISQKQNIGLSNSID